MKNNIKHKQIEIWSKNVSTTLTQDTNKAYFQLKEQALES